MSTGRVVASATPCAELPGCQSPLGVRLATVMDEPKSASTFPCAATQAAYERVRALVPFTARGEPPPQDLEPVRELVRSGVLESGA